MSMTKEQIDERIRNIDRAVSITERRQDLWMHVNGTMNQRYYDEVQKLMDQRDEMVQMRQALDEQYRMLNRFM